MNLSRVCILMLLLGACAPRAHLRQSMTDRPKVQPTEPFLAPLKGAKILSPFGARGRSYHMGVDLQRSRKGGETVLASRSGRVTYTKRMKGYGNIVSLFHKDGYATRYAHLKSFLVKTGTRVEAGQPIGLVGQTGRASTPHLHFEIITPDGKFIDPLYFLNR